MAGKPTYEELEKRIQELERTEYQFKRTEEALSESETHLRTVIHTIPDLVWLKDLDGIYLSCNPKFERFFGAKESDIVGKTDYDFVDKDLADFFREKDKLAMAAGVPSMNEEKVTYADDGHKELLETVKTPMHDSSGRLIGVLGIARDITARKKLETQLQQTQKMETIGTLAGGIAHDFNNILVPIVSHTELLLEDTTEDSPFRDNLNGIYTGALRAKALVEQILTFSRQDTNELKPLKIQPIIRESLELIQSVIPTTIEIKQCIRNDCGIIKANTSQIHQIVMNLFTNAFHAMEDTGGELKVNLQEIESREQNLISPNMKPGTYACLTVADTGLGMDKALAEKIFDPFFTTKEKGTGMGLSFVHGIVIKMNGAIKVFSEPGKGAEFKLYFPIEKRSLGKQSIQTKEPILGEAERILLVDDEEIVITVEKQILERLGYRVTSCRNGMEALETFRSDPYKFDLVITDLAMPSMPGDKLSAELGKIRPDIPILLCTGFSETISKEKAASLGIKGFLKKPVVMKDLSQRIYDVLNETKN